MAFAKKHNRTSLPGGFFHLEEEKTRTRATGYGHGDHIKLKDEYGNIWLGSAELADGNTVVYRFRDGKGRTLSGVSDSAVVILRDGSGNIWKGIVD